MAVGDDAVAGGFPLVPPTGNEGLVRWGSREINRTRDYLAQVKKLIPVNKAGYQTAAGIKADYGDPSGGENGDIYFKIVG